MLSGYYRSIYIRVSNHQDENNRQQAPCRAVSLRLETLDESLLLLASEAAVAVEALAFAVAVVEATVGAVGELGEIAEVVVDLNDSHAGSTTSGDGVGTSASSINVHLKEILDTGLARLVSELDGEVASGGGGSEDAAGGASSVVASGGLAVVGGALGVLEVAVGGLGEAGDVLHTVVEAVATADRDRVGGGALDGNTFKDFVGEGTELVLHEGSSERVISDGAGTGSSDGVGGPLAAIGVVVAHEELLASSKTGNLDVLLLGLRLDGGQRVVTTRDFAVSAVSAAVAQVALAALDLAGVPKLVLVAVELVGVGFAGDDVGVVEAVSAAVVASAGRRVAVELGVAGEVLVLVARAVAAVEEVAGELLNVLAGTVAGAALRAGGAAAALALIAVEALALGSLAVAGTLVAALGVVVRLVGAVGGVSPSEGEGAGAEGAVSTLPVLVARALALCTADAVATAGVGAGGGEGDEGGEEFHDCLVVR